jgi:ADP-ribose pyrophosphatase
MSNIPQRFSHEDVDVANVESLYDGYFKMTRYTLRHKLYEGGWNEPFMREVFERGHAVAVLPYDPKSKEFVLIEQFRVGAMETSETPWLIEVIAGIIDEGEAMEDVVVREAKEEANIHVTDLIKACSYLASPGGTTERLTIYVAKVDASEAGGVHGLDYESEDILVHRVSEDKAKKWLDEGIVDNAAAIIALQWFFMNKDTVLSSWT